MALVIVFTPKSTLAQYDESIRRLKAAGQGSPKGRLYHACFGADNHLRVVDVWSSQADFDQFGAVMMPILAEVGIDPGTPDIQPAHNILIGQE